MDDANDIDGAMRLLDRLQSWARANPAARSDAGMAELVRDVGAFIQARDATVDHGLPSDARFERLRFGFVLYCVEELPDAEPLADGMVELINGMGERDVVMVSLDIRTETLPKGEDGYGKRYEFDYLRRPGGFQMEDTYGAIDQYTPNDNWFMDESWFVQESLTAAQVSRLSAEHQFEEGALGISPALAGDGHPMP